MLSKTMLSKLIEESYINEVSRWKNEVAAGNLSPESIERLKKEGVAKTPEEYVSGLRKGTENIVKQSGYNYDDSPMEFLGGNLKDSIKDSITGLKTGGAYSNFLTKTVRAPKDYGIVNKILTPINTTDNLEKEIAARHEADEAKFYQKLENQKNYLNQLENLNFNLVHLLKE